MYYIVFYYLVSPHSCLYNRYDIAAFKAGDPSQYHRKGLASLINFYHNGIPEDLNAKRKAKSKDLDGISATMRLQSLLASHPSSRRRMNTEQLLRAEQIWRLDNAGNEDRELQRMYALSDGLASYSVGFLMFVR